MNEKTKTAETIGPLHRVNFTYINGVELRSGTLIVPAANHRKLKLMPSDISKLMAVKRPV